MAARKITIGVIVLVLAALLGASAAYAATLGSIAGRQLGSGAAAVPKCATTNPGVTTSVGFNTASTFYSIRTLSLTTFAAGCRVTNSKLTIAQGATTGAVLANTTGVLANSATVSLVWPANTGANVNDINNTNSAARVILVVYNP